ncbi:hypothetical protein [Microbacterium tumbae]
MSESAATRRVFGGADIAEAVALLVALPRHVTLQQVTVMSTAGTS